MIDFHTHILPGIDDGSKDIDMTESMLRAEAEMGVSQVIATPHFYADKLSVDSFLMRRKESLGMVDALLERKPGLPGVTPGAEVYYFSGMGRAELLRSLCIEGTDMILLEMPFRQWEKSMAEDVNDIIRRLRLKVVLAHTERYIQFQRKKEVFNEIISMPLVIQMNAGSLIKGGRGRRFCLKLLKENDNCIIGSDCHNTSDRQPDLSGARGIIEKKLGAERLGRLDLFTENLMMSGQ